MLTFREFFALLSERVGEHLLPVQLGAHDIGAFLAPDGVLNPLDRRLARHIYRANRCGHLDARICPHATFSALGCLLQELTVKPDTDVAQVALVESVGEHLRALWQERVPAGRAATPATRPLRRPSDPAARIAGLPRA